MAGSRKWMVYTSDAVDSNGAPVEYSVQIDESNGELLGFLDIAAGDVRPPQLPKGMEMRHVNVIEPATGATRKLPVGAPSTALFAAGGALLLRLDMGATADFVAFLVQSAVGEIVKQAFAVDTGLTDGDAT
jgi:hypothetical protein